jgi:hypothetical protein
VRHLRVALAITVLAGGFSLLGMAVPDCAYACSCIQPRPIAEYAAEPDTLVLSGTVTAVGQDMRGTFRVDRWYKGSSDIPEIPIQGGNGADCGLGLAVGQELVMVAFVSEGILSPNICSPWGDLSTPEGRQLRADAVAAFGEGTPPGGAEEPAGPAPGDSGVPGIVVLAGVVVAGLVAVIAGASFVSSRRGS